MLIIWHILFLLLENAHSQPCTSSPLEPDCNCNQEPSSTNWQIICNKYDVKYISNGNILSISCENQAPINQLPLSILQAKITSITETSINGYTNRTNSAGDPTEIRINGCLLRNASFAKILNGIVVKTISIQGLINVPQEWSGELFKNLDQLEKLSIKFCPAESEIPEDMFAQTPKLSTLYLENNTLSELPGKLLHKLENLKYFSLMGNNLQTLPTDFFDKSAYLEELHLNDNNLVKSTFNGLSNLKVLDMSNNNFSKLEENLFAGNIELVSLNLGCNHILNMTTFPFQNLSNLKDLDISYNGPDLILPKKILEGLNNLETLNITDSHFTNLPDDLLQSVPKLKKLLLGNNRIEIFPTGFFAKSDKLEILDLIYNDLKDGIPYDTFQGLKSLQYLNLKRNNFSNYPDQLFVPLHKLNILHMEENFLTSLQMEKTSLMSLRELFLDKNNIRSLNEDLPFGRRTALLNVSLAENQLQTFNFNWSPYNKLEVVNFSNNNFTYVKLPYLYSQSDVNFYLNNCSIETVDPVDLENPPPRSQFVKSTIFYLDKNKFICDCNLLNFKQYLKNQPNYFQSPSSLTCSTVRSSKLQPLLDVDNSNFNCIMPPPCPYGCFCSVDAYKTISIDCKNNNLTTLPAINELPNNISIAHFDNNRFVTIMDIHNPQWENLTELYLDNNQIQAGNWLLPKSLQILSLSNNRLTWFPYCLQDFLSHGTKLYLGNNPWTCNCSAYQFYKNISASRNKLDAEAIDCTYPNEKTRLNMNAWSSLCSASTGSNSEVKIFVPIAVCLFVALITIITAFVYYHNKRTIYAYMYIHWHKLFLIMFSDKDLDDDRHYHAFVSYSSSDRHIVAKLIEKLELSDPAYRLCIHERDWLPGNLITWNIVNSVQNSRRTVLILSKDFIKSIWFQLEYNIAYYQMLEDKVDRIIVIVNGDLPDKDEMDKDLQVLLSTKTYLLWGERWFWEKLKYALPHQQHSVKNPIPMKERPNNELIKKIEDRIYHITSQTMEISTPSTCTKDTACLHKPGTDEDFV